MKVLMTVYPDAVVWPYAIELARALEHDGVTFTLGVMGGPLQDVQRAQLRTLLNVEFYESPFRPHSDDAAEIDRAGRWLLELTERADADIVHLNELSFGALRWPCRPLLHAIRPEPVTARVCESIRAAGALVAPSRVVLEELQAVCGAARLMCAIPPGRRMSTTPSANKEPMIAGGGSFNDPAAGAELLSRAAAQLGWPVFVLAALSADAAAPVNTHFLGALSDADRNAVLARAGIFARPARAAGFSYDVLDAAIAGCALVLGDVADLREQWDGAAAFVNPDNEESLRGTLTWLMNDADARADLGSRARARAALFTAEKMGAAYLSLYIELALRSSSALYERISGHAMLDWPA